MLVKIELIWSVYSILYMKHLDKRHFGMPLAYGALFVVPQ